VLSADNPFIDRFVLLGELLVRSFFFENRTNYGRQERALQRKQVPAGKSWCRRGNLSKTPWHSKSRGLLGDERERKRNNRHRKQRTVTGILAKRVDRQRERHDLKQPFNKMALVAQGACLAMKARKERNWAYFTTLRRFTAPGIFTTGRNISPQCSSELSTLMEGGKGGPHIKGDIEDQYRALSHRIAHMHTP